MKKKCLNYDVVVIGGGFSGSEASMACARRGLRTLIISINMDTVSSMQFGNILNWKQYGHLFNLMREKGSNTPLIVSNNKVFEINEDKGALKKLIGSVVIDRKRYSLNIKEILEKQKNLDTRQGLAVDVKKASHGYFVRTSDYLRFVCSSVIICTGTYLDARIIWGENKKEGGRPGEIRSFRLYENLKKNAIDFRKKVVMSSPKILKGSINKRSSNIRILRHKEVEFYSVLSGGKEKSDGTMRDIFIIPEGIDTEEMYVYGFENMISEDEQLKRLRMIKGLEDVYMVRPGYGINYSYISPCQTNGDLELKGSEGLFFAGRVNGAETYEECMAHGLVAGLNACRLRKGKNTLSLDTILPKRVYQVFKSGDVSRET